MRRAARTDENHNDVCIALARAGCSVLSLVALGGGVPDLLVARGRRMWLIEIKKRGARGELSSGATRSLAGQTAWAERWRAPVYFVSSPTEALQVVGAIGRDRTTGDRPIPTEGGRSG